MSGWKIRMYYPVVEIAFSRWDITSPNGEPAYRLLFFHATRTWDLRVYRPEAGRDYGEYSKVAFIPASYFVDMLTEEDMAAALAAAIAWKSRQ